MTPSIFLSTTLDPALTFLAGIEPNIQPTDEARVLLLAIGLQESGLTAERQINGPARGLWQFESEGVADVFFHAVAGRVAQRVCAALGVAPTLTSVYQALDSNVRLAACFARLLLWTDPKPLPPVGLAAEAYVYYAGLWRHVWYRRSAWGRNYLASCRAIESATQPPQPTEPT